MSGPLVIRAGATTDRGLRRETNEDALVVTATMCAVADGMGGHEAGEVASALAVRTLGASPLFQLEDFHAFEVEEPEPPLDIARFRATVEREMRLDPEVPNDAIEAVRRVRSVLWQADQHIQQACEGRAGTTITGVWLVEVDGRTMWIVFNTGDSRTYRLLTPPHPEGADGQGSDREGAGLLVEPQIEQLTVDHSEVQYLVSIGQITSAQALVHPRRNVITRALGTGQVWEPDVWVVPARHGERLMLCSDGLTNELSPAHMARVLASVPHPKEAADVLLQAALRTGGRDNVTVIVADAVHPGEYAPGF